MDAHAQTTATALAEAGGEARGFGSIANDLKGLHRTLLRIRKAHPGADLRVCCEAGPAGSVIARRLARLEIPCAVVAPFLIPSRSGDRIRTDTRDAVKLARLHRAGELTPVHVPDARDEARIKRLEEGMAILLEQWHMKPVVRSLMGMRGFQITGAMIPVSELGNGWRFAHPRQLMAYPGLVPSENSSGGQRRQGAISKTGNGHARWLLVEAAHHYRLPPKVSRELSLRQEGLSDEVKRCSWKAQTRLHKRLVQLRARGRHHNKTVVAVARELVGFVWEIFRLMEPRVTAASVKA